ncbi:0517b6fe-5561-4156-8e87-25458961090c [Sclerotinia trifoliorum]|uniref:0517b6fe-5561-4156-8e87-25458961090c n=1 Tax=Sclerotinia trifoliorum TaxID=28548 RepID=A0A8H2VVT7_9HELO|nr:0517b6fe-5561-4156-8e87-25458961090c [Sclerotinia trifoliorum]
MFTLPLIIVAGGLFTLSFGAPLPGNTERDSFVHSIQERAANSYTVYSGNGDANVGWPTQSEWISSYDDMFDMQNSVLKASCTQFGEANNSDDEISDLKSAISEVASTTGIDSRFILAIVMQESNGCVRAPTTVYSISNPGLMQSHEGSGSCNSGSSVQNPCPKSEMVQMVTDGTAGTSSGDGLKQCLAETGVTDVSMYYKAARIYNSGSIASGGNLGNGVATHCYATDVANRLTGWYTGTSSCNSATIGSLTGSAASAGSSAISSEIASASSVISSIVSSVASEVTSAYSVPTSAYSVPTSAYSVPTSISVRPFFTSVVSAASAAASNTGGIFAQVGASSSSSSAAPTSVSSAVSVPTAASSSIVESTSASSAISIPTAASSSIAESTSVTSSTPIAKATPSSTSIASIIPTPTLPTTVTTATSSPTTSITYPSASSPSSQNTTYTPGSTCTTPGQWNCIDGTSFQQCSSGTWSSVGGLAAGTACKVGKGKLIDIFATDDSESKHKRHVDAGKRGLKHAHLHVLKRGLRSS